MDIAVAVVDRGTGEVSGLLRRAPFIAAQDFVYLGHAKPVYFAPAVMDRLFHGMKSMLRTFSLPSNSDLKRPPLIL